MSDYHVLRGNSFYREGVRSAYRYWDNPHDRNDDYGFRVVVNGVERKVTPQVLRGGGFNYLPYILRTAYRSYYDPDYRNDYLGFRVAVNRIPKKVKESNNA